MSSLISFIKIKGRLFHSRECFIDGPCAIDDGGEFERSIWAMYLKELELKVKYQGDHATFLNLDKTIKEGTFKYNLFDRRDSFPYSIIRMSRIESNIPQSIFLFSN